ncbi:MAG: hypothetical protein JWP13_514 [Candidatus Saccharibacteria bacterium]|nr:hypothetical protein [Candidatus Saccharibacteria bacterium]
MFDHRTLPQSTENYFAPGGPEATLQQRATLLRNAIAREYYSVAAADPSVISQTTPVVEPMAAVEENTFQESASAAGEAAVSASVSEVPEPAEGPNLFDVDPALDMLNQDMFLKAAQEAVEQAHRDDQELQNA